MSAPFRPVPGYEGYYEVSDGGVVRSLTRTTPYRGATRLTQGRVLRSSPNRKGYLRVTLFREGQPRRDYLVHRLVLEVFVGPCPEGFEARHIDGCRTNNYLANLAWGTSTENKADMKRHGTLARGERAASAKLTTAQVEEIRLSTDSAEQLARRHGVCARSIYNIRKGTTWAHVGGAT